jgi:hypothetical protein
MLDIKKAAELLEHLLSRSVGSSTLLSRWLTGFARWHFRVDSSKEALISSWQRINTDFYIIWKLGRNC